MSSEKGAQRAAGCFSALVVDIQGLSVRDRVGLVSETVLSACCSQSCSALESGRARKRLRERETELWSRGLVLPCMLELRCEDASLMNR